MQLRVGDAKVVNTRYFKGQNVVWRRRQTKDGTVFTTRERVDLTGLTVAKKKPRPQEAYQPAKLLISLVSSLSHREDALEAAWALLGTIENKLTEQIKDLSSISSRDIVRVIADTLKSYDKNAFLTYARYHGDVVSKQEILEALK